MSKPVKAVGMKDIAKLMGVSERRARKIRTNTPIFRDSLGRFILYQKDFEAWIEKDRTPLI